jgi:hypothetical protein
MQLPSAPTPVFVDPPSTKPTNLPEPPPGDKPKDPQKDPGGGAKDAPSEKGKDAEKKAATDPRLTDSLHCDDCYGLKSLFDSLHPRESKGKHWYEKLSLRGYTQFRYGRSLYQDSLGADPFMTTDRSINGNAEDFSVRRARFILSGDVSDYLGLYAQVDLANTLPGTSTTFFDQLRDLYGDVYLDKDKVHRFRVGLSKVPYGWENMQSSSNRFPLDRSDPINSAVSFNERDLGVYYYWTPEDKQKLLKDLVDGGLKGSGNYGIFAFGVYNGQGLSQVEQNLNLHMVSRLTWPFQLPSGQVVEASIQGITGEFVVQGAQIRPLGNGDATTPAGTGGNRGLRDQRIAGTFVWYPQPLGFQAEWNWGEGPGLNDTQTAVVVRPLTGGYAMVMYKIDTPSWGIFTPYCRYQHYRGGYKVFPNAPYGTRDQWDLGVEWQIRREMELVVEYNFVDGVNLNAVNREGVVSYRNFDGGVLRAQFQINY